jgi:hypothetical protein
MDKVFPIHTTNLGTIWSGKAHVPAALNTLPLHEKPKILTDHEAGWASEL